jgi:hypothetical protein
MNITDHFKDDKTVRDTLVSFMDAIEEWQSQIEGTPVEGDLFELDKIYTIAEVELRFIINNDHSPDDDTSVIDLPKNSPEATDE